MVPIPISIFKARLEAGRLTGIFNKSMRHNLWEPHRLETPTTARDAGGIRHETGIILDLLEELQTSNCYEHMFFLPAVDGENLLSKQEILQIAREIANGIYIHDTVPFFSLDVNSTHQQYPIIHPAYQNTYVGYAISMLDYYLKGFWTGQIFDANFIQEWNKNPLTDEKFLREHCSSIEQFCNLPIGKSFRLLEDIIKDLAQTEGVSLEQLFSIEQNIRGYSCRIIGKQSRIQKNENLFIVGGDIDLVHAVEGIPVGEEQEVCFRILDRACEILCAQIKEIGFALPEMKKWLTALKVMNFFSCYFRTLQEAEKVPHFNENFVLDTNKVCLPLFPPIPKPPNLLVILDGTNFLHNISDDSKKVLQGYCQTESEDISKKERLIPILANILQTLPVEGRANDQLSQEEIVIFADTMLSSLRVRYTLINNHMRNIFLSHGSEIIPDNWASRCMFNMYIDRSKNILAAAKGKILQRPPSNERTDSLEGLHKEQKNLEAMRSWMYDPLHMLMDNEQYTFDIRKNAFEYRLRQVFGGYEPKLEDRRSEESLLGKYILQKDGEKLSQLEYEEIIPITIGKGTSASSGFLFKLPFDDPFPISSYGIDYNLMALTSPIKSASDSAFLSAIHAIRESDETVFNNIEKEVDNWESTDMFGKKAIHYAAASESLFFLQILIKKEVDLLAKDSQGWTALHYAADAGNVPSIELLLTTEKSLLNIPALNGEMPIYVAVQKNHMSCVKKFLQVDMQQLSLAGWFRKELPLRFDVNLNAMPTHGWNLLMAAIHHGYEELAIFFVKIGKIDLEYAWQGNKTALHFAIEMELEKTLETLLIYGADRDRIYNGKTPIALAKGQNWERGIELLNSIQPDPEFWCSIM